MFYPETVTTETYELIVTLQSKPYLNNFVLVGGTALALQLGHRTSTDIDLFTTQKPDTNILAELLKNDFNADIKATYVFAVFGFINNIKTDIVYKKSHQLQNPITVNNIQMASLEDLAAMKLETVNNRGKLRDFVDIYILLQHFSMKQMFEFWSFKFDNPNWDSLFRSLHYFEDAQLEPELKWFFKFDWNKIKKDIMAATKKIRIE